MANQPFYHLRPNKSIDRSLFVQTLIGLSQLFPITDYQYTGFGSYLFDDFKLLHETLNISEMISLEKDSVEYERAKFNIPYNCIDVKNIGSTEYLSELFIEDNSHNIFWLDFVNPSELGMQLADYATLLNILNPGDIIRITLNANPGSLGKKSENPDDLQKVRLKTLQNRVPDIYFPISITPENMTTAKYPLVLLKILKNITMQCLIDEPPYSSNFMLPLFSSVYADGQQMLTFTGIILDSHQKESEIEHMLMGYPHNTFMWDKPCYIEIPALSVREITELNKLLPATGVRQQIINKFPFIFSEKAEHAVDSYISYYKFYPNYHQVSF
ncbi:MAG: hypothetical protein E7255_08545 [Lachnospiraceae bacterium]|nr:hypothetical protein [Lachnospiraceae bacterium]